MGGGRPVWYFGASWGCLPCISDLGCLNEGFYFGRRGKCRSFLARRSPLSIITSKLSASNGSGLALVSLPITYYYFIVIINIQKGQKL